MLEFKFFNDNEEEEDRLEPIDDDSPSWTWESNNIFGVAPNFDIIISNHSGIHDFLSMFPRHSIQVVRKITGWSAVDGDVREHTGVENYPDGWGFDITRDRISIEWLRFNP